MCVLYVFMCMRGDDGGVSVGGVGLRLTSIILLLVTQSSDSSDHIYWSPEHDTDLDLDCSWVDSGFS